MSKLIKVCHFTSAHKCNDVRIFHKECVSLANAGFDVTLIATNCESQVLNGVKIIGVENNSTGRFYRMTKNARNVYKAALALNADIYHVHDPEQLPFALKLKRKGKKVIYDAHEDLPRQILGKYWINKWIRSIVSGAFEIYENYVAKRVDYIIAATPFIKERFLKVNKNTLDVCNYTILKELVKEVVWTNKKNEICYVGGITKIRGITEVVKALEYTTVKLNLAGEYSPLNLRDELMSLKGWQQVNEYGFIGMEQVSELFVKSKIGMVTLYPQINYLDSLPIKMFEYMLAGIPVIASDFLLWKKIIEENNCGMCVDPLNPKAISSTIDLILSDDAKAEKMGQNGRKVVLEKYNWSVEEKKLVSIYNNILK